MKKAILCVLIILATFCASPDLTPAAATDEIVLYYVTFSGYSTQFLPVWQRFRQYALENCQGLVVRSVRCEGGEERFCFEKGIEGYPTVVLYPANRPEIFFSGPRTFEALIEFIRKHTRFAQLKPDLTIRRIEYHKHTGLVCIELANLEACDIKGEITIAYFSNLTKSGGKTVKGLPGGSTIRVCLFRFKGRAPETSPLNVKVVADPIDQVAESNEQNNTCSRTIVRR